MHTVLVEFNRARIQERNLIALWRLVSYLTGFRMKLKPVLLLAVLLAANSFRAPLFAADQPQWGDAWTRNMVSRERNLPDTLDLKTRSNIKWTAKLGSQTHSTPIVASGRIYIGTNNDEPRDPKHLGDRGVFMCFAEKTGALLWQFVVPKRDEDAYMDWPRMGMSSPATIEGDRVYLVDNRGAVVCLDAKGLADGNDGPFRDEAAYMTPPSNVGSPRREIGAETKPQTLRPPADGKLLQAGALDADILWKLDLVESVGIWPHDAAHSSILIHGDHLYLNTASGVDNTHKRIRAPDAPALVVLDKTTGKLLAREKENIAPNVFHNSWCSPSMGKVNGRELVLFCGGNGVVYAFEPLRRNASASEVVALSKAFQFDFDPTASKTNVHQFSGNRREGPCNIYGMPVFHQNRIYVAGGGDLWWGKNEASLKCIDATKTGDITTAGLVWSYPLEKHVMSTPAVYDGLVFIADCGRTFHCVDANTGKAIWTHGIKGEVWASPLVADGKVYLGTRSGDFYIFSAAREKKLLAALELGNPISATATAANGTLYVATMTELLAIESRARAK
jgi:outer membrane protein assembly factor BamB